ncbi:MAG: hypothetical protein ACREJ2_02835 [Planctomycetota bacterium]
MAFADPASAPQVSDHFTPTYVSAQGALQVAMTKSMTEATLINGLIPQDPTETQVLDTTPGAAWSALAKVHAAETALSPATVAYMRGLDPCATTFCSVPVSKTQSDEHFAAMLAKFRTTLAEDTVRDEYQFHAKLHAWLLSAAQAGRDEDRASFNERVYRELFLTPHSDPWLGLIPEDTFSALDRDGLAK